jgi:putative addiction module CopG family antidote
MASVKMSITVPAEMAEFIESRVKSGEYASESAVVQDGVRALVKRDAIVESWLENQVASAYDALKADPSRAVSGDSIRDQLYRLLEQRSKNAA